MDDKHAYSTPELTVHGSIEQLTQQIVKSFGASDGFTFQGVPIGDPGDVAVS